jgi:hypothetical protein
MDINNPTETASFFSVAMNPVMAFATKCREIFIAAKPLTNPASLMVEISGFLTLATFTLWVEGKIRLLLLGILFVFTLAFFGCTPQPT